MVISKPKYQQYKNKIMGHRITDLYPSLVGSHIEFRASGKVVTDTVETTRRKVEADLAQAKASKGALSIYLMAEMIAFYKTESYYGAIRSSLSVGRFSKDIQSWLDIPSDMRVETYKKMLGLKGTNREVLLKVIRYLLQSKRRYLKEFKTLLTKEEMYYVT